MGLSTGQHPAHHALTHHCWGSLKIPGFAPRPHFVAGSTRADCWAVRADLAVSVAWERHVAANMVEAINAGPTCTSPQELLCATVPSDMSPRLMGA